MKKLLRLLVIPAAVVVLIYATVANTSAVISNPVKPKGNPYGIDLRQIPSWSANDLEFFLHGSMGTEVVPERMLAVFQTMYPDLFPGKDLSEFGLIAENSGSLPIGISRREVPHLANLPSLGINCASCHVGEAIFAKGSSPQRIIGTASHFDVQAYFNAIATAMARTTAEENMKRFVSYYLRESDPAAGQSAQAALATQWEKQQTSIREIITADATASKDLKPGALHPLKPEDVELTSVTLKKELDLGKLVQGYLKLFHNVRASLHIPDEPRARIPAVSGPGRNDAFGLLASSFFNIDTVDSPVKHGIVWNLRQRRWVHWDGNNDDPIARNLSASLGLGAPIVKGEALLDFTLVERHTALSQEILPPPYPLPIDQTLAMAGEQHFQRDCASCHTGPEDDHRLSDPKEIGTDPSRAAQLDEKQAELYQETLKAVKIIGFTPREAPPFRITRKYWAPDLAGVWARSPYLHNGSVRTLWQLLEPSKLRPAAYLRGSIDYDPNVMGYLDDGTFVLHGEGPGNSPAGHEYGTKLSPQQKRELLEYLKTL